MSAIYKYTIDSFGFIPHLWQVWRDPVRGMLRCIAVKRLGQGRANITAELLPRNWRAKE